MKMTKKKVFVAALAVCLVAIASLGTLAWFSDSDAVDNRFQIAESGDDTADKIFSIDIWEIDPESNEREEVGHTYESILPGDSLKKDVFVKNTGRYDQYVRVVVKISDAAAWLNMLPATENDAAAAALAAQIFKGLDITKWDHIYNNLSENPNASDLVYVLYYKDVLKATDDAINVFDSIEIPKEMTREEAAAFGNEFTISIKAQAVQTENVVPATITAGKTAAWEAFNTVGLSIDAA